MSKSGSRLGASSSGRKPARCSSARIDDRKLGLCVAGAQVDEEIEGGVDDVIRARSRAVDLVDDDDGGQAAFERLAQHKARLGHRPFDRIHQQQHAVDHVHDALDLAAKIGVPRRVDDVDGDAAIFHAGVLGQDRDAALAFEVVGVHNAFDHGLIVAKNLGLAQHPIDERSFAVIDVGDNGDIANVGAGDRGYGGRLRIALHLCTDHILPTLGSVCAARRVLVAQKSPACVAELVWLSYFTICYCTSAFGCVATSEGRACVRYPIDIAFFLSHTIGNITGNVTGMPVSPKSAIAEWFLWR